MIDFFHQQYPEVARPDVARAVFAWMHKHTPIGVTAATRYVSRPAWYDEMVSLCRQKVRGSKEVGALLGKNQSTVACAMTELCRQGELVEVPNPNPNGRQGGGQGKYYREARAHYAST